MQKVKKKHSDKQQYKLVEVRAQCVKNKYLLPIYYHIIIYLEDLKLVEKELFI